MIQKFSVTLRQIWIDAVVAEDGEINRASICEAFGISVPQASLDLRLYQHANPGRLFYDRSFKVYRTIEGSKTQFGLMAHAEVFAIVHRVIGLRTPAGTGSKL
jgi:hypothetical protein